MKYPGVLAIILHDCLKYLCHIALRFRVFSEPFGLHNYQMMSTIRRSVFNALRASMELAWRDAKLQLVVGVSSGVLRFWETGITYIPFIIAQSTLVGVVTPDRAPAMDQDSLFEKADSSLATQGNQSWYENR